MDLRSFVDPTREEVDLTAAAYLLSAVVNDLGNETVERAISEVYYVLTVYTYSRVWLLYALLTLNRRLL